MREAEVATTRPPCACTADSKVDDGIASEEPASAPAEVTRSWVAWRRGQDDEDAATAVFVERQGDIIMLAESPAAVVGHGAGSWLLEKKTGVIPLVPCGEPADGSTQDLLVKGLVRGASHSPQLVAAKHRPLAGQDCFHNERITYRAQFGPFLIVEHEAATSRCPASARDEQVDTVRAIELSNGTAVDVRDLYTATEIKDATKAVLPRVMEEMRLQVTDMTEDELRKAMALITVAVSWTPSGEIEARFTYFASPQGPYRGRLPDTSYAVATVPAPLPSGLSGHTQAPPAEIIAFWGTSPYIGRGFAAVDPAAREAALSALRR